MISSRSRARSQEEVQTQCGGQPNDESNDGSGKRIPAAAYQELANGDAINEKRNGAPHRRLALRDGVT